MMQPLTKKIWTFLLLTITCSIAAYSNTNNDNKAQLPIIDKFKKWMAQHPDERLYLSTDKTLYDPGETVWFTVFVRNGTTLTTDSISDVLHIEVINPKGTVENHLKYVIDGGTVNGNFTFGRSMPGGIYKFKAYTMWQLNDSTHKVFEKEITLQNAVMPNLIMKLDFKEKGYNPGQTATADLELKSLNNEALKQQAYDYTIMLQGDKKLEAKGLTDDNGKAVISYTLPTDLQSADGLLSVKINYKGNTESISRSIPINLKNVVLEFYPEGGDMVAGITSNIAFAAVDGYGKPANIEGTIYSADGTQQTSFSSYHHGMGKFSLSPKPGQAYYAKLSGYADRKFELPAVADKGICIEVLSSTNDNVSLKLKGTTDATYVVATQMRGQIFNATKVQLAAGEANLYVPLKDAGTGVAQITVFNLEGAPLAERLVFVNKEHQLNLQLSTDKAKYAPHDKVNLSIKATDDKGKPISGDITVSVVDDKVISLANDKQGNILAKLLLEADITGDVLEPNFYFDKNEPKAAEALNLLMMTRGWRRITWQQVQAGDTSTYTSPEKTIVAGVVRNFRDGKPARGAYIQVYGGGPTAITDKYGRFELQGIDLSRVQTLMVRKPAKELYYSVNEYGTNHDLNFQSYEGRSYTNYYGGSYTPPSSNYNYNYRQVQKPTKPAQIKYEPGTGKIYGKVVDENNEGLISGSIIFSIEKGIGTVTDFDGNFELTGVPAIGKQKITFKYLGYDPQEVTVEVLPNQNARLIVYMNESPQLLDVVVVTGTKYQARMAEQAVSMDVMKASSLSGNPSSVPASVVKRDASMAVETASNLAMVEVVSYKVPLIDASVSQSRSVVTEESLQRMPTRSISDIVAMTPGVFQIDQGQEVNIRGGRAEGTEYYIDGVKVRGTPNIPIDAIDNMRIYTGHLPARYGDATSGVVEINTRQGIDLQYYSYRGTQVKILNENARPRYSYGRVFPTIVHKPKGDAGDLYDNRKTIYWSGALKLDESGHAKLEFYNGDELTTFRITAEGIADNGLVGRSEKTYAVQAALTIEAKLPLQALTGDVLDIPVSIINNTDAPMQVALQYNIPSGFSVTGAMPANVEVAANSFAVLNLQAKVGMYNGMRNIGIQATSGSYKQTLLKQVNIKPIGYPTDVSWSGNCTSQTINFNMGDIVDSSMTSNFVIYPSSISSLLNGAKGILQMPHGCFEQVSSSTYPNIMALQLLRQTNRNDEYVEQQALSYIGDGYQRLMKYEVVGGGFDLWGQGDANIPMTAYGLMEFVDMKKVYGGVDEAMLQRTKALLMGRLRGDHFDVGTKNSYFYGASNVETANAYIAYALTETGEYNIDKVVNKLYDILAKSKDSYQLALLANTLANIGHTNELQQINSALATMQKEDGSWPTLNPSVTGSTGLNLSLEATALAILALDKEKGKYNAQISKAIEYLLSKRGYGGRFGSTQATILSLKAIIKALHSGSAYGQQNNVTVSVNGNMVSNGILNGDMKGDYTLSNLHTYFKPGNNTIELAFAKPDKAMAFSFGAAWQSYVPANSNKAMVELTTALSSNTVQVGDPIRLSVNFKNKEKVPLPNPVAIVEIPSGLSLQAWQLKELKEKKEVDYFELYDNSVVLYFSELKANETRLIPLDLKTETKGEYRAAASVGYLYYTDEHKHWSEGPKVTVK